MIAFHYHHNKFYIKLKTKINKFVSVDFHKAIYSNIQEQNTHTHSSQYLIFISNTLCGLKDIILENFIIACSLAIVMHGALLIMHLLEYILSVVCFPITFYPCTFCSKALHSFREIEQYK